MTPDFSFLLSTILGVLAVAAYLIQFSSFRKVRREDLKEQGKKEKEFEIMEKNVDGLGDIIRKMGETLNTIENKITEIGTKIDALSYRLERNEDALSRHVDKEGA